MGGTGQTFLCKACNSFLGTAYEASADKSIAAAMEDQSTGATTERITLGRRGGPHIYMNAVISGEGDHRHVDAEPVRRDVALENRFAAGRTPGETLLMQLRVPGHANIKLAYLSWAYLLLFGSLGYAFVFSEAGRLARTALLAGSTADLSQAFLFRERTFRGMTPAVAGLLIRSAKSVSTASRVVAIAAAMGGTVVALPLGEDPDSGYDQLLSFMSDGSSFRVMSFKDLDPAHESAMHGIAAYRWQSGDGPAYAVLSGPTEVKRVLDGAKPPPRNRPSTRGPVPDNPGWPPSALPLPPEPRDQSWRQTAREYLGVRGVLLESSAGGGDDASWIEEIEKADPIAARHVSDMRRLFLLNEDPEAFAEPRGFEVMEVFNAIIREHDPEAHLVGADFRLVDIDLDFGSMSVRVLRGDEDIVVGPHYSYDTLLFALRRTLDPKQ